MKALEPGEIVLENATRAFALTPERSGTLKELFVSRSRGAASGGVRALDAVDLRVAPGEAVGLIGRNGAGKTSTLRCLAGIVPLDAGRAECGGRTVSLLELGAGFGADFSGRENILLSGALHGFGREEMEERVQRIIDFSELGEFIDAPVKAYSSGMQLRLGFSIVAHLDADVMLIDEVLAVGDESFQRKCMARIAERMAAGATLVLVSHDPSAIERICRRVVVLDGGRVVFDGQVADGLLHYHRLLGDSEGRARSLRPDAGRMPLEVVELELVDADGRARAAFRTGEQMGVRMRVRAREPAGRVVVAVEVRDQRGELCFRADETIGAVDCEAELSFSIERVNLMGGDYDVAVGALDQDAPTSPQLDRVARFAVAHSLEGQGIADLRGRWSLVGRREVPAASGPGRGEDLR